MRRGTWTTGTALVCALGALSALGLTSAGCSSKSRSSSATAAANPSPSPGTAPSAAFATSPNPASGPAPLAIAFTDTSGGAPTAWSWDFGDGSSSTSQHPQHTYTLAGTYTVTLTVSNASGQDTLARVGLVTVGAGSVGSRFWYESDTFGQPLKVHTTTEATWAQEVLTLVNQERAKVGLPALTLDPVLTKAAKAHCEDMVGRSYFDHFTPEGWGPTQRVQMLGGSGGAGENIAYGQQTPQAVMTAWMNSAGHRENILRSSYTRIGVGVDQGGGPHWAQVFQ